MATSSSTTSPNETGVGQVEGTADAGNAIVGGGSSELQRSSKGLTNDVSNVVVDGGAVKAAATAESNAVLNADVKSDASARRISGLPDEITSNDRSRLSSSSNGASNLTDLAASFDRLGMSTGPTTTAGSTTSSGGIFSSATAADGQQSLLQRAMNRDGAPNSNLHSSSSSTTQPQHVQHQQSSDANLTPVFNERFLFSDDELEADDSTFVKKYNLNEDDNTFPVLIRHESQPGMLSASSAALDLAPLAQTPPRFPRGDANDSEWPQFANRDANGVPTAHESGTTNAGAESYDRFASRRGRSERNSPRNMPTSAGGRGTHMTSTPANAAGQRMASNGHAAATAALVSQGFHTPQQDRSIDDGQRKEQLARAGHSQDAPSNDGSGAPNAASAFAPFAMGSGFPGDVKRSNANDTVGRFGPGYSDFHAPRGPGGGGGGGGGAAGNRSGSDFFDAFAHPSHVGKPQGPLGAAHKSGNPARLSNSAAADAYGLGPGPVDVQNAGSMKLQQRKGELDTTTPLEELQGEIFALCKDQHGCRYLQKKLEEGNPSYRDMIFTETFSHFAELMTDPFGNYLCQKMLEYCTDEQRNLIVESVAPDLVNISLNMHGTRAVQKTIDFLSTPRQIHSIIMALGMNVVPLIKDLNGNHVVQKCLNRLGSADNQFIYDAVAAHCVEVATHRHGCCVLQRCIDHASDKQRMQLVQEITFNALTLVQDPFGNYVVQYILDLNDSRYSEALVRQFVGHVCTLSVQKFSSNVIEKCIRVSEPGVRKQMIEELLNRQRLEKLLRDSFANYVVQTSLDYADPVQRMQLVECIKPTLPVIRNTPYGKRIQSKLQRDNIDLGPMPGNMPYGMMHHHAAAAHQQQMHAMAAMQNRGGDFGGNQYGGNGNGGGNGGYGMHHGGRGGGGNFGRQSGGGGAMGHIPPAQAMYGAGAAGGRGGGYGAGASAGFGAPGQATGGGGAYGAGRHSAGGGGGGFGGQQQQPYAQNGFSTGPQYHHGNAGGAAANYGGQY